MRSMSRTLALVGLMALGACGSIPQTELAAYTSAFTQARAAGDAMVMDSEAAAAEIARRSAVRRPPARAAAPVLAISPIYTPPQSGAAAVSAYKVRLLAWEAIDEYNQALAALNAGESVDTVKKSAGRLFEVGAKLAGSAAPGGGAAVEAVKEIAALLERARLASEFKRAIVGGVPTVRKMVAVFAADTRDHYTQRATLALADYERAAREPGLRPAEREEKRARVKSAMDEFRTSLDNYVRLLDQLDRSLRALQAAVDRPIDFATEAGRILDLTIELRQHWTAYQNVRG